MKKIILTSSILLLMFFLGGELFAQAMPESNMPVHPKGIINQHKDVMGSPVFFIDSFDNPLHPVLASSETPNAWYPDRYAPHAFERASLSGDNVLHVNINVLDDYPNRPSGYQSTFYNTQGRDFDISNGNNTSVIADLYIGPDWNTNHRRADLWATGYNASDNISAYPVIGFANTTGSNPTFRVWNDNGSGAWINVSTPITYGTWYTLKFELVNGVINYYINGTFVYTYIPDPPATTYFGDMMIQGYNFGDPTLPGSQQAYESYDIYWDNVGAISKIKNNTTNTYYATIQAAVNAASTGNVINLDAGTFEEQLEITKNLTIQGSGVSSIIKSPATLPLYFTTSEANHPIVYIHGTSNVILNNLMVNGFGRGNGNYRFQGVAYYNAGGTVSNCTITAIRETPINGDQHGVGLYCYDDATGIGKTLNVTNNIINDCQKNATVFTGSDLTVNVNNNVITGSGNIDFNAQNGIEVWGVASGTVSSNIVSAYSYTPGYWTAAGILVLYNDNTVLVNTTNNTVSQCQTGIYYYNSAGTISGNNVNATTTGTQYDTLWGIVADPGNAGRIKPSPFSNGKIVNHHPGMTLTAYTINVNKNTLSSNYGMPLTTGLTIYGSAEALTVNATQNTISGYGEGVWIGKDGASTVAANINNNNISGNTAYGVYNTLSTSVDATDNWWGTENGPKHFDSGTNNWIPSNGGDKVSDNVTYTPWIGQTQEIANINSVGTNYNFNQANTTLNFNTLPPGTNATIDIQRTSNPGVPAPSGGGTSNGVYLNITATGLANYSFEVTVTLDVSSIPNFSATTVVMYYSTVTNSWVAASGTYYPSTHTYVFTTNHFTTFGFLNPSSPSSVDGLNIATGSTLASPVKWYPHHGMNNTFLGPLSNDWDYSTSTATFYVVPTGTQGIFASKFIVTWDPTLATLDETPANVKGNYFGSSNIFECHQVTTGEFEVNYASANLQNVVPADNQYLAKLKFTILKPGYNAVSIVGTDFRSYSNNATSPIVITANPGAIYFYLGDFVTGSGSITDPASGDAKINDADLAAFSTMYWQTTTSAGANWVYKYDVGPTSGAGTYFDMPNSDGQINFEDLVIFAIGYGKYANFQLQQNLHQQQPLVFETGKLTNGDNGLVKLPVKVSGNVEDLRGFSMTLNTNNLEYAGVEKQGPLSQGLTFLMGRETNGQVQVDGAIVGGDAINHSSNVCNVLFRLKGSNPSVTFETVKARNSGNVPFIVQTKDEAGIDLPTTFGLSQNYPNPFNPGTLIKYQVPKTVKVTISVYDILGKLVTRLVDGEQQAGYYSIEWKAINYASGIYFYKMTAGDFTSVKKMMFVK